MLTPLPLPQSVDPVSDNTVGVIAILSVFVLAPIALAYARLLWKRASQDLPKAPPMPDDLSRRLQEMQTSIDSMAIEMERISEGQRFLTKALSERPVAKIPAK